MSSIAEAARTLYRPNMVVIEGGEAVERVRAACSLRVAGARRVKFDAEDRPPQGATAYYGMEGRPLLTPRQLTALVPISQWILKDPDSDDAMIDTDAAEIIGLREDLAFLHGTGTGGEPVGLWNMAGIRAVTLRKGALTRPESILDTINEAWGFVKEGMSEDALAAAKWAAFLPWDTVAAIEVLNEVTHDNAQSGTLSNGLSFFGSTQIGNGRALIANMSECVTADHDRLEVSLSTEASYSYDGGESWVSAFQHSQVLARVVWYHDLKHRRPGQVIALKESEA